MCRLSYHYFSGCRHATTRTYYCSDQPARPLVDNCPDITTFVKCHPGLCPFEIRIMDDDHELDLIRAKMVVQRQQLEAVGIYLLGLVDFVAEDRFTVTKSHNVTTYKNDAAAPAESSERWLLAEETCNYLNYLRWRRQISDVRMQLIRSPGIMTGSDIPKNGFFDSGLGIIWGRAQLPPFPYTALPLASYLPSILQSQVREDKLYCSYCNQPFGERDNEEGFCYDCLHLPCGHIIGKDCVGRLMHGGKSQAQENMIYSRIKCNLCSAQLASFEPAYFICAPDGDLSQNDLNQLSRDGQSQLKQEKQIQFCTEDSEITISSIFGRPFVQQEDGFWR